MMGWFLVIVGLVMLLPVAPPGRESPGAATVTVFWIIACLSIIALGVAINKDWFF